MGEASGLERCFGSFSLPLMEALPTSIPFLFLFYLWPENMDRVQFSQWAWGTAAGPSSWESHFSCWCSTSGHLPGARPLFLISSLMHTLCAAWASGTRTYAPSSLQHLVTRHFYLTCCLLWSPPWDSGPGFLKRGQSTIEVIGAS